ncbi:MAG: hypothetical protein ACRENU_00260 [Gemmatimonadaceae bacterium]
MRFSVAALLVCGATQVAAGQVRVPCVGQRIDSIAIDAQAPTVAGLRRVPIIGNVVRGTHVITRADVVRGYLLLDPGDRCQKLRLDESERILRAQPFIADASIDVVPNLRGGVTLVVHTIDEASLILSGSLNDQTPQVRSVRVGSANLAGIGVAAAVGWRHEPSFNDRLQVQLTDYQFAGQPFVLNLVSNRDAFSRDERAEMSFPFRTDVQRIGWRTLLGESRGHAQFVQRDSGRLALGFGREYAEVGGIARLGPPGRLSLLGLSMTNERVWPDTLPKRITDLGFASDTAGAFAGRFMETRATRINALLGVRGIRFLRVRGFDALRGLQDVPLGLQFGTLVGRGLTALGATSDDIFVASDLYIGFGNEAATYRLQVQGEGRRGRGSSAWDGLVGSGRFSRYHRVSTTRTRIASIEWSGTERVLVPHSLSLGVPEGGLRGFRNTTVVGGRRGIARLSEQFYINSPFDFGDLGLSWFADAGRLWKGDLPYGERTPVRASAGIGMLLAVPMRSTRMWRLEFAAPINPEPGGDKWELRLSHSDRTTFFWREPVDVDAARARIVPASIYSWP